MKKVLESELLAQLRRDQVDAVVRMAHAAADVFIKRLEDDDQAANSAAISLLQAKKDYREAADAFEMAARESLTTLPDECEPTKETL